VRDDARSFRRTLTVILSLLGLLTAGSVLLFGHLLFKSLSQDVVQDALLHSRLDAERIARGVAERSSGDLYTLKYRQKEIDTFVGSTLSERQILNEVRVEDNNGKECDGLDVRACDPDGNFGTVQMTCDPTTQLCANGACITK